MRNIIIVLLLFTINSLYSYQWPSSKDDINFVFCSEVDSRFLDGVEFSNSGQGVYPMADGEIVYYQDSMIYGDLKYSKDEGNVLYIKHSGDYSGIYRNFSTNNDFETLEQIHQSDLIGTADMKDLPFSFSLLDEKQEKFMNPQLILPTVEDVDRPVIGNVSLVAGKDIYRLARNKTIPAGYYKLYIDTYDVIKIGNKYRKITPFQIYVFVDGFKNFDISFSSIKQVNEKIYISGDEDLLLEEVKDENGYYYGGELSLTSGKSSIEIVIKDIHGNESSRSIPIKIEA